MAAQLGRLPSGATAPVPTPSIPATKGSGGKKPPPTRVGSASTVSSQLPGPSGLPNLNLSSDEDESSLQKDVVPLEDIGYDSDNCDDPADSVLSVSPEFFRGVWSFDRHLERKFLPIFLVSGHRVDFFPDDRSIRVSHHCYDVADHLHLHRNKVVSEVLTRFAPAFAILAEPEFADFLRGGELVHLVDIPKTYRDMHSGLAGSASGTQAVRPSSAALPEKSATPAADTPLTKAEKEGFTAFKLFKPLFV